MVHRIDVVGDLLHIHVDRRTRYFTTFVDQQIRKGRLRTLDLGGEQGFLADVHIEKEMCVG